MDPGDLLNAHVHGGEYRISASEKVARPDTAPLVHQSAVEMESRALLQGAYHALAGDKLDGAGDGDGGRLG